jgi:hypothetical protein
MKNIDRSRLEMALIGYETEHQNIEDSIANKSMRTQG